VITSGVTTALKRAGSFRRRRTLAEFPEAMSAFPSQPRQRH
jgi:hypothetical protein